MQFIGLEEYDPWLGLLFWVGAVVAYTILGILFGFGIALLLYGTSAFTVTLRAISTGIRDLTSMTMQRVGAIASLTFKEASRRKAFMIGFLFILLFMFGGWFLGGTDLEKPAKPYVSFVLTAMNFLLILMALLISCWGLPADIKARSLHTVVTKPVRRSEIVFGRMLGYSAVVTIVLIVTSVLGYFWIVNQVPARAQDQLIARVPVFGNVMFLDRSGNESSKGLNVGDVIDYRSFIEGQTNARAIWTFENVDTQSIASQDGLRVEQNFEAFRTFKGDVREQVRYNLYVVNRSQDLKVLVGSYPVQEFAQGTEDAVVTIPRQIPYTDSYEVDAEEKVADLIDDVIDNGNLTIEVGCVDDQQYIGMAKEDLFIRLPDQSFLSTFSRASFSLWLLLVLVVCIGTTSSCFLKGPVATLLTFGNRAVGNRTEAPT